MACSVRLLWERFVPEVWVPKFIPKWTPNPSKSAKNRSKQHFGDQGASRRRFFMVFCIFGRFLVARRPPRMAPKPPKIRKTPSKNDGRKRHVFEDVFFSDFLIVFVAKMGSKWHRFLNFSENVDLVKNFVFP